MSIHTQVCLKFFILSGMIIGLSNPVVVCMADNSIPITQKIKHWHSPQISTPAVKTTTNSTTYYAVEQNTTTPTLKWLAEFPLLRWWEALNDAQLNHLVVKALANNPTLLAEKQKVTAAQANVKMMFSKELPHLQVSGTFNRQKNSKNLTTPDASTFSNAGPRLFAPGQTVNIYSAPLALSYDLDPFFKKRLATKSVQATLEATQLRYRLLQLELSTQVVQTYVAWQKALSEQVLLQQELLLLAQEIRLNEIQYAQGLLTQTPLNNLQQQETTLRETLSTAETTAFHNAVALATLTGETIGVEALKPTVLPSPETVTQLPLSVGVPAQLVETRLDVAANALDLKAAGLDVQVAKRAFFPTISLTGQVGLSSTKLQNWFNWDSLLTSLGTSLTQPLFMGGALKADVSLKKALYEQQIAQYQSTLLNAYEAVEKQLATLQNVEARRQQVLRSRALAQQNVDFAQAKFDTGLTDFKPVVQAQQTVLQTEKQLLTLQEATLKAWSQLMLEVGGGNKV
jgi:NodT family efflux transporter outer membrane factor (OMF) lipoprotein